MRRGYIKKKKALGRLQFQWLHVFAPPGHEGLGKVVKLLMSNVNACESTL